MVESLMKASVILPEVVVYIDDDDTQSPDTAQFLHDLYFPHFQYIIGVKKCFTDYWNACCDSASGDIFMMAADDLLFCTKGWDVLVSDCFASSKDKIIMAYGDISNNQKIVPSHPIVHRNWVETVGYFSPPYFKCGSCDYWLNDVAKFLGRKQALPFNLAQQTYLKADEEIRRNMLTESLRNETRILYQDTFMQRLNDASRLKEVMIYDNNEVTIQ